MILKSQLNRIELVTRPGKESASGDAWWLVGGGNAINAVQLTEDKVGLVLDVLGPVRRADLPEG